MPEKKTIKRAQKDKREGKSPSTQAGEFVHEEIEHIREGKHGARSAKQAIASGLSKARRAGVDLKPPKKGEASEATRKSAKSAYKKGQRHEPISRKQSRAGVKRLKDEPKSSVSKKALSRQAHAAARKRTAADRSAAARKATKTKGRANAPRPRAKLPEPGQRRSSGLARISQRSDSNIEQFVRECLGVYGYANRLKGFDVIGLRSIESSQLLFGNTS